MCYISGIRICLISIYLQIKGYFHKNIEWTLVITFRFGRRNTSIACMLCSALSLNGVAFIPYPATIDCNTSWNSTFFELISFGIKRIRQSLTRKAFFAKIILTTKSFLKWTSPSQMFNGALNTPLTRKVVFYQDHKKRWFSFWACVQPTVSCQDNVTLIWNIWYNFDAHDILSSEVKFYSISGFSLTFSAETMWWLYISKFNIE